MPICYDSNSLNKCQNMQIIEKYIDCFDHTMP